MSQERLEQLYASLDRRRFLKEMDLNIVSEITKAIVFTCPKCNRDEGFFFKEGSELSCSRMACKWTSSIAALVEEKKKTTGEETLKALEELASTD